MVILTGNEMLIRFSRHSSAVKPIFGGLESEPSCLQASGVGALKIRGTDL